MQNFLTFEAFTPKNIDARKAELAKKEAKEIAAVQELVTDIRKNLHTSQKKISTTKVGQFYLQLLQDLTIKYDVEKDPFYIYFMQQHETLFMFNIKSDILWCHPDLAYQQYRKACNINYAEFQTIIKMLSIKYLGFEPYAIFSPIKNSFLDHSGRLRETFQPKNIDGRQEKMDLLAAAKLAEYRTFVANFKTNLEKLQGLQVEDPDEQVFVNTLQDMNLKVYVPENMYTFHVESKDLGQYRIEYTWDEDICRFSDKQVIVPLQAVHKRSNQHMTFFLKMCLQKYFHVTPSTVAFFKY